MYLMNKTSLTDFFLQTRKANKFAHERFQISLEIGWDQATQEFMCVSVFKKQATSPFKSPLQVDLVMTVNKGKNEYP